MVKKAKKSEEQVTNEVAEVNKLIAEGWSANRAFKKVGLINTSYYYRKRRDAAEAKNKVLVMNVQPSKFSIIDNAELEYLKTQHDLLEIKLKIMELENKLKAG